jgi:hypothetical protein
MENPLIANGAEIFWIGGSRIFTKILSGSVKHKCLSRVVSSRAGAAEQYFVGVTEMGFCDLRCMSKYHSYT